MFNSMNRGQIKQAAKDRMRTAQMNPYLFALVYILISFVLSFISNTALMGGKSFVDYYTSIVNQTFYISPIAIFATILVTLVALVLQAGFTAYCLGIRRGETMPLTTLFDGFSRVGKVIGLNILISILMCLWMLPFILPAAAIMILFIVLMGDIGALIGVAIYVCAAIAAVVFAMIAWYRYSFALIYLMDRPDRGIMESLRMSKTLTNGYKGDLFILDLSFIGWSILSAITYGFLGIWLQPYYTLTRIGYYDAIVAASQNPSDAPGWNGQSGQNPWDGNQPQQPTQPLNPWSNQPQSNGVDNNPGNDNSADHSNNSADTAGNADSDGWNNPGTNTGNMPNGNDSRDPWNRT